MESTKIYLIRHGQSIGNQMGIYLGHTNLDLSELGYLQAEATANFLKDEKIDAIYSSDLMRAHNTAVPHAKIRGLDVIDCKDLRELNIGNWEGMYVDDLKRDFYDEFVLGWHNNFGTYTVPGGECVLEGGYRFKKAVENIAKRHPGKTVLIAAHAAVIRVFWAIISEIKPEKIASEVKFPANSSFTTLIYDGDKFHPIEYSHDSHLPDELRSYL